MSNDGILLWGQLTRVDLRLQFPQAKFDRISFATTPVVLWAEEQFLGHASGFFWRHYDQIWLITNWHCVTGNNPFTLRALITNAAPPAAITCYPLCLNTTTDGAAHCPARIEIRLDLFSEGRPLWKQHADFDSLRVDVVGLPISDERARLAVCVNDYEAVELHHHVGADLFVVGYPLRNFAGWMPPYWKRGSFAGEPILPLADRPLFSVDVLSTEGMSGSPIFRRVFGPKASPDASTTNIDNIVATQFVGVYAGRLASVELERVGLGYGWYGYLVDEILSAGLPGTTC